MRLLALLAAGLFAGTLIAADDKKDDKKGKDEEAIVGTWKVEKFDAGVPGGPTAEELAKVRMTFKKDGKLAVLDPEGKEKEVGFKLDSAAKPKTIDIASGEKDHDAVGLYALESDTLTLAMGPSGSATRPTELKADGKGIIVLTLKRVKEEKKEEKKDEKK